MENGLSITNENFHLCGELNKVVWGWGKTLWDHS